MASPSNPCGVLWYSRQLREAQRAGIDRLPAEMSRSCDQREGSPRLQVVREACAKSTARMRTADPVKATAPRYHSKGELQGRG